MERTTNNLIFRNTEEVEEDIGYPFKRLKPTPQFCFNYCHFHGSTCDVVTCFACFGVNFCTVFTVYVSR